MGNASLGLLNLEAGISKKLKENLEQIVESSKFGAQTVRRLSMYSQGHVERRTVDTKVFDLSELVTQAVEMSRPLWKAEPEKERPKGIS